MEKWLTAGILLVMLSISGHAQVRNTENTLKITAGSRGEKASIVDLEWLAGNWTGTGLGGVSEEIWSKPSGGVMMGAYRLIQDGKPVLYEMMLLIETEGSLVLRLKHFHGNFVGWEEKDKSVDFNFVSRSGNRVHFSGLTFERVGNEGLRIYLAMRLKDGTLREEVFQMKRAN